MRTIIRTLCALCMLYSSAAHASGEDYPSELITTARAQNLAASAQWRALLHYRTNLLTRGVTGQADDAKFYLAVDGKINPQAELDATLRAFFTPPVVESDTLQHPQCRFVARYHWLKHALQFDAQRLPEQTCRRFSAWRGALQPDMLTLVFPAAYINNPSSMFGHTLLRVDAVGQDEQSRLLAYAINYAANPDGEGGMAFILKSLVGLYPGLFSISPYYVKVKEYSHLENRDIWEYQLNFSADEIERLLMHAWELGQVRFDYYFFDENCAYHLLSLFEAARPSLEFTRRFNGWVIPADTVRALAEEAGMVRKIVYRPADNTWLRYQLEQLNADEQDWVAALAAGDRGADNPLFTQQPAERQSVALEAAYKYLRHQYTAGDVEAEQSARRSRELLLARSRLPVASTTAVPPTPHVTPDRGHGTLRIALGAGSEDGRGVQEIKFRPAYHDLLDPQGGYTRGAQINFLDVALRHVEGSNRLQVHEVTLIDIFSLFPRDRFFHPVSWKIRTGYTHTGAGEQRVALYRTQGGAGMSWPLGDNAQIYGFADFTADISGALDKRYALGGGASLGIYANPTDAWQLHFTAQSQELRFGDRHREEFVMLEQSLALGQQHALRLSLRREHSWSSTWSSVMLGWHSYW